MTHEITHVRTNGNEFDCTCITHVFTTVEGELSVPKVIAMIQQGHDFFVKDFSDGSKVDVKPIPTSNPTYIRTEANDTQNDNLLHLPRF